MRYPVRAIALIAAAATITGAWAASPPKPARVVRVPVQLHAEPETPLRPSDFAVSLADGNRAPLHVNAVKSSKDDLMLLLITDLTGDLTLVDAARGALAVGLRDLPKNAWVGLLRAQDGLHVEVDPASAREPVIQALDRLQNAGKPGLLDTIEQAAGVADRIAAKSSVRLAILYITDGDVRNYREDFTNPVVNSSDTRDLSRRFPEGLIRQKTSRLAENLASSNTPIFIVQLQAPADRMNQAYQGGLAEVAASTGGAAFFSRTAADVPGLVAAALNAIQNQYQLFVQLPEKAPRSLQLQVVSGQRGLTARSRFRLP